MVGWEGMGIGDIDGDGDTDLIAAGEWIEAPSNPRSGSFVRHTISSGWPSDTTAVTGDINLDGRPDVVFAGQHARRKFAWYEGPADPRTGIWIEHVVDGNMGSHKVNLGDMNKDGRMDIVAGLELAELAVYTQQAGGTFTKQTLSTQGIHNQRIGDVDGDGDPEIFGANYLGNPPVTLWQNTTATSTTDTTPPSTPTNLNATAASATRINLSWTGSSDNVGVAGYRVYRGGVVVASPTGTSFADTGLNASTTYTYRVSAVDAADNESPQSAQASATTQSADTTSPVISGVSATNITTSSATITWTTNEASNTQVDYGTTASYGQSTAVNTAMVTTHSVNLSNLSADTIYHYRVKSRDQAGNLATSGDFTFRTAASVPADTTPPVISGASATNITTSSATITWTTNEASNTQVDYGTTASYGQSTAVNTAMVTTHSVNLSNLSADTIYHYRVKSRDQAGNLATSGDFTFTTVASAPPPVSGLLGYWQLNEGSGSVASDSAGGGTGTLMNGPVWTAGHDGGGLALDGSNDYVALPNLDVSGSEITIAAWVRFSNLPGGVDQRIISKAVDASEQGHYWMIGQIGNRLRFRLKAGGTTTTLIANSGDLAVNTWYHVAAVYDGSTMRLYLNGVQVGSVAKTGTLAQNASVAVNIGRNPEGLNHFSGTLDEVRIYNQSLTATEITAVMQNQ